MKALVFNIITNSLYSIRIPFTWQSALTYPILPPSAVIGMLANALQRFNKNDKHPLQYLESLENEIRWAGSRLLSPCVIKSYTTSAIVKWEDTLGGKFTNALGRQFAYARNLQIAAIFHQGTLIDEIVEALKTTPLTCGDSESPISLEGEVALKTAIEVKQEDVMTEYAVPFTKDTVVIEGNGQLYLMHERCQMSGKNFPLVSYMVPIREEKKVLKPSCLRVRVTEERVMEIQDVGYILVRKH